MTVVPTEAARRMRSLELPNGWRRTVHRSREEDVAVVEADHPADTLRIPLHGSGRRKVFLGVLASARTGTEAMEIRLATRPHWRRIRPHRFLDNSRSTIQEGCLGTFDLEPGAELLVRTEPGFTAALAWVRTEVDAQPARALHKGRAGVVFDTNMAMSQYRLDKPEDLFNVLAPHVDSDFSHIFWGTGVGTYSPLYRSDALGWHGQEQKEFAASHRARTAQAMRMLVEHHTDPFELALDFSRKHGLSIWANDRISKNCEHDFRDDYPGGRFLLQHQDKRVREIDGSFHKACTMSFAWREIREMKVRCLVEQASYGPDGLYLDFARKFPVVGWDAPVVELFREKQGKDPREAVRCAEGRLAWIETLCGFVTEFMRELRAGLEPVEQSLGRRVPIAVQVPGEWRYTDEMLAAKFHGLDMETWIREGLIDILAPCHWTALTYGLQSLDRLKPMTEGSGCRLWGAIGPEFTEGYAWTESATGERSLTKADLDPWRIMRSAADMYNQGAEGVYIWEAHDLPSVMQRWEIIRHIGDKAELDSIFSPFIGPFDGSHHAPAVALESGP